MIVSLYVYIDTIIYVCVYVCMYVCMHVCVYVFMYACITSIRFLYKSTL